MRYNNLYSKRLEDGKLVLSTKLLSKIPKRDDDIYIITQETDRLDTLAYQFYNDVTMWWVIALANNLNSGDIGVEPGIQLRIPIDIVAIKNLL